MRMKRRFHRRSGLTLVELTVSCMVLTLVLGGVLGVAISSTGALQQGIVTADLQARGQRVIDRVARELGSAGVAGLQPTPFPLTPLWSPSVEYQRNIGWTGTAIQWSPSTRLTWELDPSEIDNGCDDNRNGLIDEGLISWTENPGLPGERRVVLARGVAEFLEGELFNGVDDNGNGLIDETGAAFVREGDHLVVRLSLARAGRAGAVIFCTLQDSVLIRN